MFSPDEIVRAHLLALEEFEGIVRRTEWGIESDGRGNAAIVFWRGLDPQAEEKVRRQWRLATVGTGLGKFPIIIRS